MIFNVHTIYTDPYFSGEACRKPYIGHPKGCPNWNKKKGCPPNHSKFWDIFDRDFYLIFTEFNLEVHVKKLRKKHPDWTERQLYCCLYWQPTARKNLRKEIARFKKLFSDHIVTTCPEAMGVNVDKMMKDNAGIDLEWPPKFDSYQVAVAGLPKKQ